MIKRTLTLMGLQAMVGLTGASYMAAPEDANGHRDALEGVANLLEKGPAAVTEKLGGDYQAAIQQQVKQLSGALGQGSDDAARELGLDGLSVQGLMAKLKGTSTNTRENADLRGRVGSESTVLLVEGKNGPEVRWRAAPSASVAPEEELRQVLAGAARATPEARVRHKELQGQTITITGQGKDVQLTVKIE